MRRLFNDSPSPSYFADDDRRLMVYLCTIIIIMWDICKAEHKITIPSPKGGKDNYGFSMLARGPQGNSLDLKSV